MKRLLPLFVAALVAVGLTVGASGVAGAAKYDNCDLLTKKQAAKIVGHKVVATKLEREKSSGAEQCEWRTNYYFGPQFKKLDAPYKLQVTTQPLTDEVEATVATLRKDSKSDPVAELGDNAFFTPSHELLVVLGPVVLQVEMANYSTEGGSWDDIVYGPPVAAAKLLIPLFEDTGRR